MTDFFPLHNGREGKDSANDFAELKQEPEKHLIVWSPWKTIIAMKVVGYRKC